MNWLWYIIPVVLVAAIVGATGGRSGWAFASIAIFAAIEVAAVALGAAVWRVAAAVAVFYVVVPWAMVAGFTRLMREWKRPLIIAMCVPLVYFVSLAIGAAVGDVSGMVPQ